MSIRGEDTTQRLRYLRDAYLRIRVLRLQSPLRDARARIGRAALPGLPERESRQTDVRVRGLDTGLVLEGDRIGAGRSLRLVWRSSRPGQLLDELTGTATLCLYAAYGAAIANCHPAMQNVATMAVPRITKEDLKARLDADPAAAPTLLDVRLKYPYEHSTLKLPGAIRMVPESIDTSK